MQKALSMPFSLFPFFVFACNAKSFAIAVIVFFSSSFLPVFQKRTGRRFFVQFYYSLPRKRVTRIGFTSLDTLENYFVSVLSIIKLRVCKHDMPFALEINSNSGFKQEHGESGSSTTKNIIYILP